MPDAELTGRKVLAIVTNYGVEQDELVVPVRHLTEDGAEVTVAAVSGDAVETLVGDKDPGQSVTPDTTLAAVETDDFDLLLIPGGTLNADALRLDADAREIIAAFASTGKPVAAICHGPWALITAEAVAGKTATAYPSLEADLRNAGATFVDEPVVVDDAEGFTLITSRTPEDLEAFLAAVDDALTPGR